MTGDNVKDSQPLAAETEKQSDGAKGSNPDFPKLADVEKVEKRATVWDKFDIIKVLEQVKEGTLPDDKVSLEKLHPAVTAKESKELETGQSSKQKEKTNLEKNKEVAVEE
ncbi:hypothetical protein RIF29_20508 [Crotalaria pallida]|uniref:Uncharacterized protein n=1 Tax=Crotalaria pallida TaxID=3830 RepID=A0AAN9F342_CROPI